MTAQEMLEGRLNGSIKRLPKVYVAGPISKGDIEENIRKAVVVAEKLLNMGFAPFVPQLSVYWQRIAHNEDGTDDYDKWLKLDFTYVEDSDAVYRVDGFSKGADAEVALARSMGVPVFFSVEEIAKAFGKDGWQ